MPNLYFMFETILIAMLLMLVLAWFSIRLAVRVKLLDYPSSEPHKQHSMATPLAGGFALAGVLLVGSLLFGTLENPDIQAIFVGGAIILAFGVLDDLSSSPPLVKLLGQTLAALALIYLNVHIRVFESPEFFLQIGSPLDLYLDWFLTILWVVGITNAFNFVDSSDGLSVGLGGVAAGFFMLVTLDANQPMLSMLSGLLVGACIGLYFFNSPPALLFLGDAGAQSLGFILSVLAIIYIPQNANQSSSWLVPIMLLGVPIFDSALVIISRLRRGLPVYRGGRDHTYHRLLYLGQAPFRAVVIMHGVALFLGCLAFVLLPQPPIFSNLVFGFVLVLGIGILIFLDRPRLWVNHYHFDYPPKKPKPEAWTAQDDVHGQV